MTLLRYVPLPTAGEVHELPALSAIRVPPLGIRHSLWAPTTPAERYLGLTEKILEAANGIAKDLINRSRK